MTSLDPLRDVLSTLAAHVVAMIPNLLAATLLVLGGWLVSRLLSAAVRRVVLRFDLDGVMARAGWNDALARSGVDAPPSTILAKMVFWIVWIVFLVLAIENLGFDLTAAPLRGFLQYLPRVLGALLLLFLGVALAAFVGGALGTALARIHFAQHRLLAGAARFLLVVVAAIAAVEHLGFDVTILGQLLINLLTIFAAALGLVFALGGREVARNLLAGYYAREQFRGGDVVALAEGRGRLTGIGTLSAEVETDDGDHLILPNRHLIESVVRRIERDPDRAPRGDEAS